MNKQSKPIPARARLLEWIPTVLGADPQQVAKALIVVLGALYLAVILGSGCVPSA